MPVKTRLIRAMSHTDAADRDEASMRAEDYLAARRLIGRFPGMWDVRLERDCNNEAFILLLAETDDSWPSFLLTREGGFVRLLSCTEDAHAVEGAFPTVDQAVAVAEQRVRALLS